LTSGPDLLQVWRGVDVVSELGCALDLPVHLGNDANLGAIAEWTFGAARSHEDLIYVMMADGVGAGLILRGQLYQGANGAAGELGHVVVSPAGPVRQPRLPGDDQRHRGTEPQRCGSATPLASP
jgi:predicted NBD/HSP70 family sugar kinase